METLIRNAEPRDAAEIAAIFNFEVLEGASNYESAPTTAEARMQWIADLTVQNYPVLVAEISGKVVGFGALTPFARLSGYKHTTSGCIYIHQEFRAKHIGRQIGNALWSEGERRGFHSVIAGVNSRNTASLALLKGMGFVERGYFPEIGFKNGEWLDDVCLQFLFRNEKNKGEK